MKRQNIWLVNVMVDLYIFSHRLDFKLGNVDFSTGFDSFKLQIFIKLFPLKHLNLNIPDKLGQTCSSVSTVPLDSAAADKAFGT